MRRRAHGGFSTLAIAFVLLALTIPIVFIAESVLVAGRQATSNALGQENLRAVDAAMSEVIGEIRLDEGAVSHGCSSAGADNFDRLQPRPEQGDLAIQIQCSPEGTVDASGRVLNFEAVVDTGSGFVHRGRARVEFIDMLGPSAEPGAEMLICDWQLGEDSKALAAC